MKHQPLSYTNSTARNAARALAFTAASVSCLLPQAFAQTPATPAAAPAPPAATPAPPAPPRMVPNEGVIKIGGALKQTRGRVTDVDKGDNGCYITFRDDKKNELIEVGKFEICAQKPPLKGKQVELEYAMETIQAGDCYGDPKCKRTETVPVVISVKIAE
ncbi:MAG: hypothetical protein ABL931_14915 [Usitatibacteraceae bacterium]